MLLGQYRDLRLVVDVRCRGGGAGGLSEFLRKNNSQISVAELGDYMTLPSYNEALRH